VTDDIRTRLAEALDQAEQRARDLLVHAQRTSLAVKEPRLLGREIPGWHDWPDVEAMCARELRMIERDRALIGRHREAELSAEAPDASRRGWLEGQLNALTDEVERAAACWLGTPEGVDQ
jgi:hypothetical protein